MSFTASPHHTLSLVEFRNDESGGKQGCGIGQRVCVGGVRGRHTGRRLCEIGASLSSLIVIGKISDEIGWSVWCWKAAISPIDGILFGIGPGGG